MRKPFNAALISTALVLMSGSAFAAQQPTTATPDKAVIQQDRAKIKADREKLKADTQAGNTAAVQQDKAALKADMQRYKADGGKPPRRHKKKA